MSVKTILLSEFIEVLKKVQPGTKGYTDAQHLLPILQKMIRENGEVKLEMSRLMAIIGK